jgi:hypothetical protein
VDLKNEIPNENVPNKKFRETINKTEELETHRALAQSWRGEKSNEIDKHFRE